MPRPELGPIKPGDPVIVAARGYRTITYVNATVTKVGRLLVTITETSPEQAHKWFRAREWRMRIATQRTDGDTSFRDSFATPEQHAWDQQLADANTFLREQGIDLRSGSPWDEPDQRMRLADLIRASEAGQ